MPVMELVGEKGERYVAANSFPQNIAFPLGQPVRTAFMLRPVFPL